MSLRSPSRAKEVFVGACDLGAAERSAYLEQACGGDEELRREVESLLEFYDQAPERPLAVAAPVGGATLGERVTHYVLLRSLGSGGMGEVFEAEDLRLGRKVALKFLHPWVAGKTALRARFEREARAASALDHPNICTIYEIDEHADGRLFIAMALYEGETVARRIRRGPLAVGEALDVACQTARGLAKAHEAGVVHRDVKPANLLITSDSMVKILDFGLAKLAGRGKLSSTGRAMGTASYMSPEQARGESVDRRTDIWSLGVVLYEMLTGRLPFRGEHPQAAIYSILHDEPLPPAALRPGLGPDLLEIVLRALEKRPERRHQSMADMHVDLRSLMTAEMHRTPLLPPPAALPADEPEERESSGFVARDTEIVELSGYLEHAVAGHGLVAFVTGEAGTGKTALMSELARRAQESHGDLVVAGGNCNAYTGLGDPYLPFREVLGLLTGDIETGWAAKAVSPEAAGRLWDLLPVAIEALLEGGRDLVNTFVPGKALIDRAGAHVRAGADWMAPLARLVEAKSGGTGQFAATQKGLFDQYTRVVTAVARRRPLLLLIDDLQWSDAGSIGLLFHLGRRLGDSPILLVGAFRPSELALGRGGERHPLEAVLSELKRDFGSLIIDLEQAEGRAFVEAYLDSRPNLLDGRFRQKLFRQTDGHALYTVELLREMEERQALVRNGKGRWIEGPALDWSAVPARVEAVVAERIGRVPEAARELLVLASVEGETFTAEAVARAAGQSDLETVRRLSADLDLRHRLVHPQGVRQIGAQRLSLYRFRHSLFQRYLYGSLTDPERTYLHELVGDVLERLYGEEAGQISVELARHFEEAGLLDRAARYLRLAGEQAARRSADLEAIAHLTRGLELLESLSDAPGREELELELLIGLGPVFMAVKGWSAPETGMTYARARELGRRLGQDRRIVPVVWGMWQFTKTNAELVTALELAEQLLEIARSASEPDLLMAAHQAIGETCFWRGELEAAREHCKEGVRLYDRERDGQLGYAYGLDPGVTGHGFRSWTLWSLGYPDRALAEAQASVELAERLGHPFSLALAHYFAGICRQERREPAEALACAEASLEVARQGSFEMLLSMGELLAGWARCELGELAGLEQMRGAIREMPLLARPWFLSLFADGLARADEVEEAQAVLSDGLACAQATASHPWDADLLRRRGELLAVSGAPAREVESCLWRAVEAARSQGARSRQLRAVTSWSRHLQQEGRQREARAALAGIISGFEEGLATPDMQAAKLSLDTR